MGRGFDSLQARHIIFKHLRSIGCTYTVAPGPVFVPVPTLRSIPRHALDGGPRVVRAEVDVP